MADRVLKVKGSSARAGSGLSARVVLAALRKLGRGDFAARLPAGHAGVDGQICAAFNAVAVGLAALAGEVRRVADEVGREGQLGAQARVEGARGDHKQLLDAVNVLAGSLTSQVRELAQVTTAVARGDLSRRVTVDVRGELLAVKTTINTMIESTEVLAEELLRVGREVGTQGVLGGQVEVAGVAGIWKDIVDSVNYLSRNLTAQVRGVAGVVTAVARGDLERTLEMSARGEIATLRDNVNLMIRNLAETTRRTEEQDWLKTNLTRFTRMLQGHRDLPGLARALLTELAPCVGAQRGVFFVAHGAGSAMVLRRVAGYAAGGDAGPDIAAGEGLVGQAALERRRIVIEDVPADYVHIGSGLGAAAPRWIGIFPILFEGEVRGVIELASFRRLRAVELALLEQFLGSAGIVLASIEAQVRTDELLARSQRLAGELQAQQEALRQSHDELAEKAEQLALTSRYKSQFLANMSHELRTPLNSLLILSRQLADNRAGHLDAQEVVYARTIHQAGTDLLELINEILDLAKVESGTMRVEIGEVAVAEVCEHLERTFRHVAEEKRLGFVIEVDPGAPATIASDELRLKQILRNLLANAFKFTARGEVRLSVSAPPAVPGLVAAGPEARFVAFAVADSGIGIAADQQALIFEAFQQADGTATRKYGGTGLGLAISREIAGLLGGDVRVASEPGVGSTFTLYLPVAAGSRPAAPRSASPSEPAAAPARAVHALTAGGEDSAPAPTVGGEDSALAGRKVLVVDDDVRNIFALTGVLERSGLRVVYAENGREALERLAEQDDVALVVMDIMMPEMDGFAAIRRIRELVDGARLPILALTAKAMQGDRERCLAAGASDYITKPVDPERLIARLRVWLTGAGAGLSRGA